VIKAERKAKLQMPTAPTDGIVQQFVVRAVGGVVAPAQPLAVVVPRGMRESSRVRTIRDPCAA
jgi:hemolysin D